jgi:hypothetical protein
LLQQRKNKANQKKKQKDLHFSKILVVVALVLVD